jgi:hypothetical protein
MFTFVLARGAESSADHDIHRVGNLAFAEEDFAGGEFFPTDGGEKLFPDAGLKAAEFFAQNFAQKPGV